MSRPSSEGAPARCSHREKTWKCKHCGRGWSISAIARHLGRDRKTVRAYLRGERGPGPGQRGARIRWPRSWPYLAARFTDDPHLWATALFDEVVPLGYRLSYVSFARQLRLAGLRPHCEACAGVTGRDTIEIDHPPGEEIQWDWFERRQAPWGGTAYVLLGTLPHSSRVRGVIAESLDQPHLIEAIDGGAAPPWRHAAGLAHRPAGHGDRARHPRRAAQLRAGGQALRRGRGAVPAAARQPQGRGRVHGALCVRPVVADHDRHDPGRGAALAGRVLRRPGRCPAAAHDDGAARVGALADAEPLLALPAAPYPATVIVTRTVGANAAVAFRGNAYSVPPGLGGTQVHCCHRLGSGTLEIARRPGACWPATGSPRPARAAGAHRGASRRAGAGGALGVHHRPAV